MTILRATVWATICLCLAFVSDVKGTCIADSASTCTSTQCCYEDIPLVLGDPAPIIPTQDCYDSGVQIGFDCSGTLNGPPYNQCNGGNWQFPFGPTCEDVVSCPQPTVPTDGSISPNQIEYDLYTRIYYACDNGYSLVGPVQAVCERGGVWNPDTEPICEKGCTAPTLDNGIVIPDTDLKNGDVLNYECNTNYTLVGISTTTCRDGAFDPSTKPICYSQCNPPVVPFSDFSSQEGLVDHASTITVDCDAGYSTGTGTVTDMTCTDGDFDVEDPVCYANCDVLTPSFDNGVRSGDTSPYYHTEDVSYVCNSGYTLVGASKITCNDGAWSDLEPVCRANCQVDDVPNSDFAGGSDVDHDTSFNITCNTGYSTGSSLNTEYVCNDGNLSPSALPTCYGDCTPPVVAYSNYATQQDEVFHTTIITVTCWSNYSTGPDSQSATLTCDSGSFGDDPTCYENCPDVVDPTDGVIASGESPFFHQEVVTFQCNDNFTLTGEEQISCSNGAWSSDPPECSANCKPPVIPNSDAASSSPLLDHGESITVTCDTNYSNGQSQSSTSTCNAGTLDPAIPLCYADCTPPVVPDSDYDVKQPLVYHTTPITITCAPDFSTGSSLNTTLTCDDGTFDADAPVCYADCSPPVVAYSDYRTQQPNVYHTTEFTVSCWSNYSTGPDSQTTTLTCDEGVLSEDSVTCFENCPVSVVPNSDYSEEQVDVFHEVTYSVTCDDGYSNGDTMSTNQTCSDGTIVGNDPTCYANCPDFGAIDDGSYTGDAPPFYHEETVTFSCDTNYTLVGESQLMCLNGSWNDAIPSCNADCLPPVIINSDYEASQPQVDHGTVFNITCNTDYSTGTAIYQTLTCDDGNFDLTPKACLRDCTPPRVENSDYSSQREPVYHSESFDVTCDTNYTAGDFSPSATFVCDDGQLDPDNATCYANCPDPGTPTDGQREHSGDGFFHGAVVYYSCAERFDLNGAEEITCSDGEWSDVKPNCTDTALYDLIRLTCGPTSMEVEIPIALLDGIDVQDLGLQGDLTCMAYLDGDMMRVNTSLAGCGTNKTQNATYDTYTNRVINNYFNDLITRVVDVQIPMTCSYPRNQEVRAVRYTINDYVIGKNLEETGTYKMTFGIYNSSSFNYRYRDGGAVNIDINNKLHFQLELETDVADNLLVAQSCWGTPTENEVDDTSYDLLDDGCPIDDTFTFMSSLPETQIRFTINSFRFVDDADKEVYIHCEVFVCHEASADSFCINGECPSIAPDARRRRAADLSPHKHVKSQLRPNQTKGDESRIKRAGQHDPIVKWVKAGPIRWNSAHRHHADAHALSDTGGSAPEQTNDAYNTPDSSTAWMNSVIAMGVIIAVFSVILMAVVRHYRKRLRRDYKYEQLTTCS